eukprot:TRINITY_DN95982_c0_g1_i1.p1 TRINITY_DN95982_c0_g1~~TRINITY_DN95982_c0_g1_i1.p1  ORF type:complete len:413 (+),score=77.77 TRINITY_DN95982_c0_g1_i1:105-1343(+)
MRGQPASLCFGNVSISLPSKVRGAEAEEEWEEVDWAVWSTGDLTIDVESYLMIFNPSGTGVKAKPLGNLIRAAAVCGQGDADTTFIASTSESLHQTYRITFSSSKSASDFKKLSEEAEKAHNAASLIQDSSPCIDAATEANARLEADVRDKLSGRWPLIYSGAELYGPDPNGDPNSSEVLLCNGVVVLLDPPEDSKCVGSYELLIFGEDEGASTPVKKIAIGPKMSLKRLDPGSEDGEGPAVSYVLSQHALAAHTLCFEASGVGAAFSRDFRVRQRLMDISLRSAKGQQTAQELRGEIEGLKQQSAAQQILSFIKVLLFVILLGLIARLILLYTQDAVKRTPAEYFNVIRKDVHSLVSMLFLAVKTNGLKACKLTFGSVASEEVYLCGKLGQVSEMKRCIDSLVGRAPVLEA